MQPCEPRCFFSVTWKSAAAFRSLLTNAPPKIQARRNAYHLVGEAKLKFVYSEKATNFWEISTVDLSYVVTVKSKVEISQNSVAFLEYMNFNSTGIVSTSAIGALAPAIF